MKTFLKFYLATICLSISGNLFSQNFISENKVWNIVSEGGMEQSWIRTSSFKFSGDTTIQQTRYKKLYYSEDEQKMNWELNSLWFERNDSVFKYWPWTSETTLVYDFNIAEKDSFQIDESLTLFVDSICVKEWGGKMRRHWYFVGGENYSSNTTVWVEGVGNINNFTRSSDINITGALTALLCFSENNELVYQNPRYNDCYINSGAPVNNPSHDYQTVYSNRVALFENSEKQIKALRIDSVKVDIDSVFYPFTTIQADSKSCFSPYKASWIGQKVVVKPDGTNLFFNCDGDTITLKTRARLNETWIAFQRSDDFRVKATVQSIEMENFLGLSDSVKTITLSVIDQNENTLELPLNNLKLRISKNYGFIEPLNFCLFPDIEILGTTERLENLSLAGLTNPEVGVQNLTWFEVNDFQPGDELHILKDSSSWDEWNGNKIGFSIITKSIIKYLKRYDYMDSIVYLVSQNQSIQTIETHTDTITYNCDTTILVIKPDPQFDKLPGEPIIDEWKEVTNYHMENIDVLSKLYPGVYESIHHVKDSCWAMAVVDGCFKYETYFKGFGGPYYTCSNCCSSGGEKRKLVYYKKGETEWGEKLVIIPETNDKNPEFAPIGAEWHYSQFVGFDPPQGANYVKHTCFKDSTIDGKPVKVIQKTKFTREGQFELGFEYLHQNGDTISYWKNGEFHELYNFSLEEGDSMLIYSDTSNYMSCDTSHYGWINIDSVFSVTINNQKLKGYFASHKEGSYWGFDGFPIIEKIGSALYLLPGDVGCVVDAIGIGPLRCYSDPEFGIYYYGNEPCDTLTTFPVYAPVINSNHQFNFFPNPAASFVTISNPSNIPIKKIELTDFSGRVVQAWKAQELVENTLNIQHIPPGIYLLKATTEAGIKTGKLVVH